MALSNEFAELVNKLQQSPNDSSLKKAVLTLYPKMEFLAKDNPMALYHLAQVYAPNSPKYQQTMRQAANLGCTNAMLVMCQILGKSNNLREVRKAAFYLGHIEHSEDSYIKEEAQKLISEYPLLAKAQEYAKSHLSHGHNHRFFIPKSGQSGDNNTPLKPFFP